MTTKLQKLEQLLKLVNEGLTREEFLSAFKSLLDYVAAMKKKNSEMLADISKTLAEKNFNNFSGLRDKVLNLLSEAMEEQRSGLNFIHDKVRNLKVGRDGKDGKDGKDANEEKIIKSVLARIPEHEKMTAEQMRDMLEMLNGEERLRLEAINGLEERLKEIEERRIGTRGGGFSKIAMDGHIIDDETPGGTISGVNTGFTIAHAPNPASSLKVFLNGQRMRLTEDYTLSNKTITFLTAPPTGSIILTDYRI